MLHPPHSQHLTANYSRPAWGGNLTIKGKCYKVVMAEWLIKALNSKGEYLLIVLKLKWNKKL